MEYKTLNNGIEMPVLGFGTCDLRGKGCTRAVEQAVDCGYSLIDTAMMYGNEKEVGLGLKNVKIDRDQLFITSKVCPPKDSYKGTKEAVDNSLKELQLEYIDLYLVHEPYSNAMDMYRALIEAMESGKIKALGISNFNQRRLDLLKKEFDILPAVNQIEAHVFYPQLDFVKYMKQLGIVAQGWGPLAQGKENIFQNPILAAIGEKFGKSVSQVALRYLIQSDISVVPKSSKVERMKENIEVFDFSLSIEDMIEIQGLDRGKTLSPWTEHWR